MPDADTVTRFVPLAASDPRRRTGATHALAPAGSSAGPARAATLPPRPGQNHQGAAATVLPEPQTPPRGAGERPGARNEATAEEMLVALGLVVEERQFEVPLAGEHIYTADLLVRGRDGKYYLVEVKGPFRHGSEGRSRLAFDEARAKTGMGGLWVERRKPSRGKSAHWRVEMYEAKGG